MSERPRTHLPEIADETGERYLANLGLEWENIRGKKVLDIGALSAEFENAARRRGVDVVSVDKEIFDINPPPVDSRFVVANATQLPFKSDSFDYAVAHMSVMNYMEKGYEDKDEFLYVEDVLREAYRVLKPEGQFRFTDGPWYVESEHAVLEGLVKRAGFRELMLKKHTPGSPRPEGDEHIEHYYIAIK